MTTRHSTEPIVTSDDFLELEALPRRITFVGGGYISFEFAHVAARAGADVTLLEMEARPLPPFDPDLVDPGALVDGAVLVPGGPGTGAVPDLRLVVQADPGDLLPYHNDSADERLTAPISLSRSA